MVADFKVFIPLITYFEGDTVSDIPGDAGGLSKYGISQRSYPKLDIANLTLDAAAAIYKKDFWDFYRIGWINDQSVANKVMIYYMNMNPHDAATIVQTACGGTRIDGIIGTDTILAVNRSDVRQLLDRLIIKGVEFYVGRVDKNPDQLKFLRSWLRRALF
jgi:lysozyme family protein